MRKITSFSLSLQGLEASASQIILMRHFILIIFKKLDAIGHPRFGRNIIDHNNMTIAGSWHIHCILLLYSVPIEKLLILLLVLVFFFIIYFYFIISH